MQPLTRLDDRTRVAGQLRPEDMAALAAEGVTLVINNRPDGEAFVGQPPSAEIEAAARAAGMTYLHLPFAGGGVTLDQARAFAAAAEAAESAGGDVVAFCRSGMRSTLIWALARVLRGAEPAAVIAEAGRAGVDLSGIAPHLDGAAGHRPLG